MRNSCLLCAIFSVLIATAISYKASNDIRTKIKNFESPKNVLYMNPANIPAIGYGHVIQPDENYLHDPHFVLNDTFMAKLFDDDIKRTEDCLNEMLSPSTNLTCRQFGALVSWAFDIACPTVKRSTLISKINHGIRANDAVERELKRWVYVLGLQNSGLKNRRQQEADYWAIPGAC